jgi:hypothetical protein
MRKLIFLFSLFYVSNSWALSCGKLSSPEVIASEFNVHIFTGIVLSAKVEDDHVLGTFDVDEVFKGDPSTLKYVSTRYSRNGSLGIVVGRKYFFIVGNTGLYNICSGTGLLEWSGYSNTTVQEHFEYVDLYRELTEYYRAYNK